MATATASGIDELRSGREEEGAEEGEEVGRERGLWASPWRPHKSRASRWKQELARARRPRAPAPTGRRRKATGAREVGWPSHLGCR